MSITLPQGKQQYFDLNGDPLVGGLLHTYQPGPGNTTPKATTSSYGGANNTNPIVLDARGECVVFWDGGYNVRLETAAGALIWTVESINADPLASTLDAALRADFASNSDAAKGDALVGVKRVGTAGSSSTTQHVVNEYRKVIATVDFSVPNNGVTNATTSIEAMFSACAAAGNVDEIEFPDGTYLLQNARNDAQASCAVVISALKRCKITGSKTTKFIVNAGGSGATQFGMFRIEQCEDLVFKNFEIDGSGIVINGSGANRSFSFVLVNFDVNTPANDLAVNNKRIEFDHLYIHDIGGGPAVLPRSIALLAAPTTEDISVHDCEMKNLLNVNHGVTGCFVRNLLVYNNKFWNNIPTVTPIDCMAVDASRGTIGAQIFNNYIYGFCYGLKCETQTGAGPSGLEVRPSRRVLIENNWLEEIGDPASLTVGGDSTFGIKINGTDAAIKNNTVLTRTIGLTTGGLYAGLIVVNTHNDNSHCEVSGNRAVGSQYGVLHNDTTPTTRECSVEIHHNRFDDCKMYGGSIQGNCTFDDNICIRASYSALEIQTANMTFARRNRVIDCASIDNVIVPERVSAVYQSTVGAIGGYTEIADNIVTDSRGASAGEYAYFLRGAPTLTNPMVFRPGYTQGMLTAVAYDTNFNIVGDTTMIGSINRPGPRTFLATNNPQITAPWSTLAWNTGDVGLLHPPVVASPKGWICTVAGTPGTWVSQGNL